MIIQKSGAITKFSVVLYEKKAKTLVKALKKKPKIPGLELNIVINGIGNKNNFKTKPLEPTFNQGLTSFPLEIGQINQLEISNWKWNQISVGIILIIALILLSLSLQRFRLQMGFGFPELPP